MAIKFGIVGCGYIGNRHAEHISAHANAELVGVYDVISEKTDQMAEKFDCEAFQTWDQLLNGPIDILNVCTPNGTHHILSIQALEHNKHCLVEKPMAINRAFAASMVAATKKHKKQLFVVKQNRYNPPVQAVRKLLQKHLFGEIYSVVCNCYWNRNEQYYRSSNWKGTKDLDGGALYTQFSHFIDILYYLFGKVEVASAAMGNLAHGDLIEIEDTGFAQLFFPDLNALGSLNYTTASFQKNMEGSITIFGEKGTIKIGGQYLNNIDYQLTNGFDIKGIESSGPANQYGFYEGSMSNHDKVIDNVVKCLNGIEPIMTNAEEGLEVIKIIDSIYTQATWIKK